MCLSVSNVKGHTGVNDLKCQSSEPADNVYVCVTVSLHVCLNTQTVCVDFLFFSPLCLCVYVVRIQSEFPRCRVDQVTLEANCLSLRAQGWAALIVLWPGTRCSY